MAVRGHMIAGNTQVDDRASLVLLGDRLEYVDGVIVRVEAPLVSVRCVTSEAYCGQPCVMSVETKNGLRRGRATVVGRDGSTVKLRLHALLQTPDERVWPLSIMILGWAAGTQPLSIVPEGLCWTLRAVELLEGGLRTYLPGAWRVGSVAELRLELPDCESGKNIALRARVVSVEENGWLEFATIEGSGRVLERLITQVDELYIEQWSQRWSR